MGWLENNRYNYALQTFYERGDVVNIGVPTYNSLLAEHWQTQEALNQLGYTLPDYLHQVTHIDELLPPTISSPLGSPVIEISGMPRVSKTTAIQIIKEKYGYHVTEELGRIISKSIHRRGGMGATNLFFYMEIKKSGSTAENYLSLIPPLTNTVLFDRGEFDLLPFARSEFLMGRIGRKQFDTYSKFVQLTYTLESAIPRALIVCLIPPAESLAHEPPRKKPGRFMNPEFLKILFDQYLRIHNEVINQKERPFYYSLLNFTGLSIPESQHKLEDVISRIITIQSQISHPP